MHGDRAHGTGDIEGGVHGGEGEGDVIDSTRPGVGRPLGRAVASSFF